MESAEKVNHRQAWLLEVEVSYFLSGEQSELKVRKNPDFR